MKGELKPAVATEHSGWLYARVLPFRVLIAAIIWTTLTRGDPSIAVGVLVVPGAALASALLLPRLPWSPRGLVPFAGYFLVNSLRGGLDVARLAFHARLPLAPGIVEYEFRVAGELPRVALANTISLLPGTLGADLDETRLYVHALDLGRDVRAEIAHTERRIAGLFGLRLED